MTFFYRLMKRFKDKYRIDSTRLKGWNYANPGYYFVTICVKNREYDFGRIENRRMILSTAGEIVNTEWLKTSEMRKNVILDKYQIMPNHFHGIIIITQRIDEQKIDDNGCIGDNVDTRRPVYLQSQLQPKPHQTTILSPEQYVRQGFSHTYRNKFGPQKNNLSSIIGGFKSAAKTKIKKLDICFEWQNLFDDHLIRNTDELNRIRKYIQNNPEKWGKD